MVESKYFHRNYYKLCKRKNVQPIQELKEKIRNTLDFHPDRIKINDWLIILESLSVCQNLTSVSIKSRKNYKDGKKIFSSILINFNQINFYFFGYSN